MVLAAGLLCDGTGSEPVPVDVYIRDGRIDDVRPVVADDGISRATSGWRLSCSSSVSRYEYSSGTTSGRGTTHRQRVKRSRFLCHGHDQSGTAALRSGRRAGGSEAAGPAYRSGGHVKAMRLPPSVICAPEVRGQTTSNKRRNSLRSEARPTGARSQVRIQSGRRFDKPGLASCGAHSDAHPPA